MSTGLIVLAVTVFLVIDGAILFLVFRSRRTADDYAKIPVPGQTTGFHGMGSSLNTGSGWSRALIGTIQIAQPGAYTVTAQGGLPNAIEPQLLIGK